MLLLRVPESKPPLLAQTLSSSPRPFYTQWLTWRWPLRPWTLATLSSAAAVGRRRGRCVPSPVAFVRSRLSYAGPLPTMCAALVQLRERRTAPLLPHHPEPYVLLALRHRGFCERHVGVEYKPTRFHFHASGLWIPFREGSWGWFCLPDFPFPHPLFDDDARLLLFPYPGFAGRLRPIPVLSHWRSRGRSHRAKPRFPFAFRPLGYPRILCARSHRAATPESMHYAAASAYDVGDLRSRGR